MARYETHITFPIDKANEVRLLGKKFNDAWKFSQIMGCPLLGMDKPFCYLTSYDTDIKLLMEDIGRIVDEAKNQNIEVYRSKVERIIYDTKTGVNEL